MNSMKLSTFLQGVKEKINTPEKWTQGTLYADASGKPVTSFRTACQFCLQGAVIAHSNDLLDSSDVKLKLYLIDVMMDLKTRTRMSLITIGRQSLPRYNDTHSHSEVMFLLDTAIVKAQSDEDIDLLQLGIK